MSEVTVEHTYAEPIQIVQIQDSGTEVIQEVHTEVQQIELLVEGPPGPPGPEGPEGPPGLSGDSHYRYEQATPQVMWQIEHSLGKSPSIRVIDSSGQDVIGDYEDIDADNVVLYFSAPFSGTAFLN